MVSLAAAVTRGRQVIPSDFFKRHPHLGASQRLPKAVSCEGEGREEALGFSPPWKEF
ncbi:hypothetical protein E2C01_093859 [Portunus trituberculatus]|uniref:Uncharacterized protein n=1 Tax=Portunus trituberculatus TaxID=210409 RepID=A0A5B7JVZ7_PORTR|nr:hypothetical protein [Portunus trituberculatus]